MDNQIIGYIPKNTFIHKLNATTKLISFLLISIITMITYDVRYLFGISLLSVVILKIAKIKYKDISFIIKILTIFAILNLIGIYIFAPQYGVGLYGTNHVIFKGYGIYNLTQEQIFYELNIFIKYFATIPPGIVFILTTNPSEFSAGLNRIKVPYKVAYAFSLALRYIPDIQEDFKNISKVQQARGNELAKSNFSQKIKGNISIAIPLIFSSLERIESISNAMELRRFGKNKKRTWYSERRMLTSDWMSLLFVIILVVLGIILLKINHGRFYNPFI